LGFAYDVFGNGKWALRGGYGIFFSEFGSNLVLQNLLQPPFTTFPTVTDSGGVVLSVWPTLRAAELACLRDLAWLWSPIHISAPVTCSSTNLTLQHELGAGFLLEAGYVGTLGRKLLNFRDRNQPFVVPVNGQPPSETNSGAAPTLRDSVTFSNRKAGQIRATADWLPTSTSVFQTDSLS